MRDESVLRRRRDLNHLSAQHGRHIGMRSPGWVGNEHLIAGIQDGLHGKVIGMDSAVGDQQLSLRVEGSGVVALQLEGRGTTRLRESAAGAVMSSAILQGFEGRLQNSLWRFEIRIAHLQTDDLSSAGFEGIDMIGHRNRGRLTNKFKLLIQIHGNFL